MIEVANLSIFRNVYFHTNNSACFYTIKIVNFWFKRVFLWQPLKNQNLIDIFHDENCHSDDCSLKKGGEW